jgi:hypothetical protein
LRRELERAAHVGVVVDREVTRNATTWRVVDGRRRSTAVMAMLSMPVEPGVELYDLAGRGRPVVRDAHEKRRLP